jgi:hypothetical protein
VAKFLDKYPTVNGYDLICFLECYGRINGGSLNELLKEGLESESTAEWYIAAVRRIAARN